MAYADANGNVAKQKQSSWFDYDSSIDDGLSKYYNQSKKANLTDQEFDVSDTEWIRASRLEALITTDGKECPLVNKDWYFDVEYKITGVPAQLRRSLTALLFTEADYSLYDSSIGNSATVNPYYQFTSTADVKGKFGQFYTDSDIPLQYGYYNPVKATEPNTNTGPGIFFFFFFFFF